MRKLTSGVEIGKVKLFAESNVVILILYALKMKTLRKQTNEEQNFFCLFS